MAFAGGKVSKGRGFGVVVATGDDTLIAIVERIRKAESDEIKKKLKSEDEKKND
eukprot:CAMPEP_0114583142 /NCGR_PEP_ID=MMETSP0125-20121206/6946_1 /TAXON_ID=485358 ORGANISM="Aristerostoma sp., Strain ATCC 50986" /NCGR_SAMPLE_ID=MMETSP0125 /ASSEMBLY_ACC=CAM_ASM_000245 /LENGTH=53 /DNA_ID=CAMNT_0001776445 /DNA_START=773 /DNA_END=934 /DNA_ORIENTATION=+